MIKSYATIELYYPGAPISKIIKQLKVPNSTVYDALKRYKELSNTKDRPKSGCSRSCRTKSNIKAVLGKDGSQTLHERKWLGVLKWIQN